MRCRETPAWTHLLISDQREHASMDPWKKKHSHQTKRTWAKKGAICNHLKRSLSCMLSPSSFPFAAFSLFSITTSGSTVLLSRKASIKDTRHSQSHIEKLCALPCLQMLHHGNWPSPRKQTVAWLEVHSILLSFWMTAELCWTQAPQPTKCKRWRWRYMTQTQIKLSSDDLRMNRIAFYCKLQVFFSLRIWSQAQNWRAVYSWMFG